MVPTAIPTGTVSSGRDGASASPGYARDRDADPDARIAELERENEALRAAVERQRRENERIVERYERLLERERSDGHDDGGSTTPDESPGAAERVARFLGL
jgi:hypothetical protein